MMLLKSLFDIGYVSFDLCPDKQYASVVASRPEFFVEDIVYSVKLKPSIAGVIDNIIHESIAII